uniref:Trichome birefringence-like C-terminal domain-containing protein n=1 Tax=Oryza punctata TaxID=4537 RepID=A0A0E0JIL8_ORYPU
MPLKIFKIGTILLLSLFPSSSLTLSSPLSPVDDARRRGAAAAAATAEPGGGGSNGNDNTAVCTQPPLPPGYAVRASFRTALRALCEHPVFRGTVIVRMVAPPQYENGKWYDRGNCLRTRPNETGLPETEAAFHAQVDEFRAAVAGGRFLPMDVSEMMQMCGDGHPGQYNHWPHKKVGFGIDRVHWCLSGPVDAWNELLLHLLSG